MDAWNHNAYYGDLLVFLPEGNKKALGITLLVWQLLPQRDAKVRGNKIPSLQVELHTRKEATLEKLILALLNCARKGLRPLKEKEKKKASKFKEQAALFFISYFHYQVPILSLFSIWKALRVREPFIHCINWWS